MKKASVQSPRTPQLPVAPPHAMQRRLPIGAELHQDGVSFRVWAPQARRVRLVCEGSEFALKGEGNGYFSLHLPGARAGLRYRFRVDGAVHPCPDPASRFQPEGPHGPSEVVDPDSYAWQHPRPGTAPEGRILYEMHFGTFTGEGTCRSAIAYLGQLAELGINTLQLMPVNEFPGRFNWGYDGVGLFAPCRIYGRPDDLRAFVDAAHGLGLSVILDVVYNHLGPDGNYLTHFSPHYFTRRYSIEWGEAINFDGAHSAGVREFFTSNAACWIGEYRLDGLRLDATQCLFDSSAHHIIGDIARAARAASAEAIYIVGENEPQRCELLKDAPGGGQDLDALWNDDFHHCARVALAGHNEAYLTDYGGSPQEFISAVKWGFLYQGQHYRWQQKARGTPTFGLRASAFINYLENHDQVANSGLGRRLVEVASPGELRALTALLLLGPGTPLLFQGQEFGSTAPWVFFANHGGELRQTSFKGRREFVAQFPSLATREVQACLPDPGEEETFLRCKLREEERPGQSRSPDPGSNPTSSPGANFPRPGARFWFDLHKDLIALRRREAAFSAQCADWVQGAVLATRAFALRFRVPEAPGQDRLLLINLGADLVLSRCPEPLLAPPSGCSHWMFHWSSDAVCYGGEGAPENVLEDGLRLRGRCAVVLAPA